MRKFLIFVSIICLLALVGCTAMPATPVLPTQTVMVVPTATVTPSLPKPVQSSNLQPVNNAEEVFENGSWLVKNADGKITATWNTTENAWDYNAKNLQMVFAGATEPNTKRGLDAGLSEKVTFIVPYDWEVKLPEDQKDPNPLVALGVINTRANMVEIGVDFRGIKLAEPAGDKYTYVDRYVAGFSVSDPKHPDLLYTFTMPIIDLPGAKSWVDLDPNGSTTSDGVLAASNAGFGMDAPEVIKVLQNPSTVGRRMVIELSVPGLSSSNGIYTTQGNQDVLTALTSGLRISGIETTVTGQALRLPKDLDSTLTQK